MIDLDEGLISVAATHVPLDAGSGTDLVLVRYLALVHRLRGLPVGTAVKIRDLDIAVLAVALETDEDQIERRLQGLMTDLGPVKMSERDLRHRLLVPLAGVVVASTAVGVLLLVSEDATNDGTSDPDRVITQITGDAEIDDAIHVTTDVGDAVVIERGDEQTTRD